MFTLAPVPIEPHGRLECRSTRQEPGHPLGGDVNVPVERDIEDPQTRRIPVSKRTSVPFTELLVHSHLSLEVIRCHGPLEHDGLWVASIWSDLIQVAALQWS